MNYYESNSGVFLHCQICGCEIGTPNIVKCTNQTLTQGLLWKYNVCDICARAINDFIEEYKKVLNDKSLDVPTPWYLYLEEE